MPDSSDPVFRVFISPLLAASEALCSQVWQAKTDALISSSSGEVLGSELYWGP